MKDPKSGEEKRKQCGLRLVPNPPAAEDSPAPKPERAYKSRFAQQLAAFADQIDQQVDEIMKI